MISLLKNRRSVRSFKEKKIGIEILEILFNGVLTSPAGHNIKHVEYIFIDDKEVLEKLSVIKAHGSEFLKDAPQAIAVIADESKTDVWIEDASIAATVIQLTAESLGLGSCWIQMRQRKDSHGNLSENLAKEILGIENCKRVECIVALGYAKEPQKPHLVVERDFERVKYNSYSNSLFKGKD